MILIFPSEPYEGAVVDSCFAKEFEAAKRHGFKTVLYSLEEHRVWAGDKSGPALYRGWMLSIDQYTRFRDLSERRGLSLLADSKRYQNFHHLPEWYHSVSDYTPKTVWFEGANYSQEMLVETFQRGSLVLKDFVKSAKHYWETACFIPEVTDDKAVASVVDNFLKIREDDLVGGLVFRRFLNLRSIGNHPKSGMPLTLEYRLFFFGGKLIACFPYWETDYPDEELPTEQFVSWAEKQGDGFFTLDVACDESGKWWIIEFGDAQVSGLPTEACLDPFYSSLAKAFRR